MYSVESLLYVQFSIHLGIDRFLHSDATKKTMTDVEMKDPAPAKEKSASKAPEGSGEGKKKFEVKKVRVLSIPFKNRWN